MAGRLPPQPQMMKNILQLVYLLQLAKNGRQATIQLAVIVHSSVVWITSPTHHFYLQYYLQSLPPASCHLLPLQPLSHIITELEYHFWSEHHLCLQYTEEREREILYAKASLTSFSLTFHVRLSPLLNPLESSGLQLKNYLNTSHFSLILCHVELLRVCHSNASPYADFLCCYFLESLLSYWPACFSALSRVLHSHSS